MYHLPSKNIVQIGIETDLQSYDEQEYHVYIIKAILSYQPRTTKVEELPQEVIPPTTWVYNKHILNCICSIYVETRVHESLTECFRQIKVIEPSYDPGEQTVYYDNIWVTEQTSPCTGLDRYEYINSIIARKKKLHLKYTLPQFLCLHSFLPSTLFLHPILFANTQKLKNLTLMKNRTAALYR